MTSGRLRSTSAVVLAVLGCLLSIVSLMAVWARNQVLDTDRYLASVLPLASEPAIQDEVATKVATAINAHLDAESLALKALPSRARLLAPAVAGAMDQFVVKQTAAFVHSDAFVTVWSSLNRTGHEELVTLLTGNGDAALALHDGKLRLDLGQVVSAVRDRLAAAGLEIVTKIPPITLVVDIADARGVERARDAVRVLDKVATWLPVLTLVVLGSAVALAQRRLRALYLVGLGIVAAMVLARGTVDLGEHVTANQVPSSTASSAAVHAFYVDVTSLVQRGALLVGLVFAVIALIALAGPTVVRVAGGTPVSELSSRDRWRLGVTGGALVVTVVLLLAGPPLLLSAAVGVVVAATALGLRRRLGASPSAV